MKTATYPFPPKEVNNDDDDNDFGLFSSRNINSIQLLSSFLVHRWFLFSSLAHIFSFINDLIIIINININILILIFVRLLVGISLPSMFSCFGKTHILFCSLIRDETSIMIMMIIIHMIIET